MPTAAERRALWFLAGVITLGAGARAVAASRTETAAAHADPRALTGQLAAVDAARIHQGHTRRTPARDTGPAPRVRGRRTRGGETPADSGLSPAAVLARELARGSAAPPARVAPSYVAPPLVQSYLPPSYSPLRPSLPTARMGAALQGTKKWFEAHPLDVDVAIAADLEALPGVGPSLAKRIVAERDAHGPFGSLRGLERVRGIGPALSERLRAMVTFSGIPFPGARPAGKSPSRGRRRPSRG